MTGPRPPWKPPVIVTGTAVVSITSRQADVLDGFHFGLTNAQIGNRLGLAEDTIKTHAKALFRALGAHDRAHAVALARHFIVHVKEQP